jgi:hypothetical protein
MAEAGSNVVADYKSPDGERITHIRSTLISSSIQTLKALGFMERYLSVLPERYHGEVLAPRAPSWTPVDEAATHYNACEGMHLSPAELEMLSETAVTSIGNTLMATFNRNSRTIEGGSPWLSLGQAEKLFARMNLGGSIRISRRGEREALVEVRGGSLYTIPYYEMGHCALLRVAAQLFVTRAYVRTQLVKPLEHRCLVYWE